MSSELFVIMMLNMLSCVVRLYYKEVSLSKWVLPTSSMAHEGNANYRGTTFNLWLLLLWRGTSERNQ
jgi:hypothetical protein